MYPTLPQLPKQVPPQPSVAPHRLPLQLGVHEHDGHVRNPPQPFATRSQ